MQRTLVAIVAALCFAAPAQASTVQDLTALGYTVGIQFSNASCTAWSVSGFGVSTSLGCAGTADFQAAVDSMANPAAHCGRKWQHEHSDQSSAATTIRQKGWTVTAAPCVDQFAVTHPSTQAVKYQGGGAGLVALAGTITAPETAPPANPPAPPAPPAPAAPPAPTPAPPITATTTTEQTPNGPVNVTVNVTIIGAAPAPAQPPVVEAATVTKRSTSAVKPGPGVLFTMGTRCLIGAKAVPCSKLWGRLATARSVTVTGRPTRRGVVAQRIALTP